MIALALAGCAQHDAPAPQPQSFCAERIFEESAFTVCDAKGGQLRLIAAGPDEDAPRSFSDLAAKIDPARVAFAMNAGMFDEEGRPIGLAVSDGLQKHAINLRKGGGNFHLLPNGVFVVEAGGRAAIHQSKALPTFKTASYLATQSGPMLVIKGKLHPSFEADGKSRYVRNGVGVRDGRAIFVISEEPVSFGKLARFFRDSLKTPDALYFDGAVSSLWDPANGRQDSYSLLGPMIVAFRPAESAPDREGRAKP
ncbi:phosphodiester glycosidase family protein [Sphingomonas sinipercae]|uniref:phosphodiester glycosidase family protein n=1 Tax=Sphingomonas sinipercae TaxID=2714944 RepID=UPI001FE63572|nr:phosphodiester glycosidase family protein [Sphingomonas sinipercae]